MLPLYEKLCGEFPSLLTRDSALVARMEEENAAKLSQLEDTIRDAEENLGESEIREGYLAKAVFYYETGDLVCVSRTVSLSACGRGFGNEL